MQNVCVVPKARLLWMDCVQSHSQGTAARSSSETLQDLKASGGKCCLVFSFPGHRFFSVAWTILPVSLTGMYYMEFAFLH